MTREMQHYCPHCDAERTFYKSASTMMHLGRKTKWYCEECDYQLVKFDGDIDSTATV